MGPESPRITELRRRVESDPSSIAFAQLAEEYRRAGHYEAAERYCRTGLARHPAYLSARVTLGRTLIELDKLDEAQQELKHVLTAAPDNLAALRGVAEIHQRLDNQPVALEYYRRALALSRHDPELEEIVERLEKAINPAPPAPASPPADSLMDFDALLDSLGIEDRAAPPGVEALLNADNAHARVATPQPSALDQFPIASLAPEPEASGPEPGWMTGPLPEISGPVPGMEPMAATAPPEAELLQDATVVPVDPAPPMSEAAAVDAAVEPAAPTAADVPVVADAPTEMAAPLAADAPDTVSITNPPEAVVEPVSAHVAAAVSEQASQDNVSPHQGPRPASIGISEEQELMILDELEAWLRAIKR